MAEKKSRIEYTPQGYSYVKVDFQEVLDWGGYGICNGCAKIESKPMYLVWCLSGDTYCEECFNDWIKRAKEHEEDLILQNERHIKFYDAYGVHYEK